MKIHRSEQEQMHMMMHDAYKAKCMQLKQKLDKRGNKYVKNYFDTKSIFL